MCPAGGVMSCGSRYADNPLLSLSRPPLPMLAVAGVLDVITGSMGSVRTGRTSSSTSSCMPILCAWSMALAYDRCRLSSESRAWPTNFPSLSNALMRSAVLFLRCVCSCLVRSFSWCEKYAGDSVACLAWQLSSMWCSAFCSRVPSISCMSSGRLRWLRLISLARICSTSDGNFATMGPVGLRVVSRSMYSRSNFCLNTRSRNASFSSQSAVSAACSSPTRCRKNASSLSSTLV
mmetsp:Transcript_39143/g.96957  ORF Transcript_39143/g.96957 Transcript_39143/m.96957 type:complete len:234 (+) Transcript_39143:100-801(+)